MSRSSPSDNGCVIVTGAASGIGAAIVRSLAARGRVAVALDMDEAPLKQLASQADGKVHGFAADLTDAQQVSAAIGRCLDEGLAISGLVNNVGGGGGQALQDMTLEAWNATLHLNLTTAFLATKAALPALIANGGGEIVNIGSIAAFRPSPVGGAAYAAAKAGLVAFTRQCAHELARHHIRVNAVCPGPTRTALTRNSARASSDFPLGRWIEPEDVAATVLHLLEPASAMCTGSVFTVDGGIGL